MHPSGYYESKFCAELGLCDTRDGGQAWGENNFDPLRVREIAEYLLAHPEFEPVGHHMLIAAVLESVNRKLETGPLTDEEIALIRRVVEFAMADTFGRFIVADYAFGIDEPGEDSALFAWFRQQYPGRDFSREAMDGMV